ncbi:MAG: oxidoreductase [Halieaceae bacterium]|nr:oxidoreductase [Halieaceae bacterium]
MSIVLAGGTGVIGQALLDHAGNAHDIITVGRRPTERAAHEIVADFTNLPALPPAETAICVLGTTIGKAGSRKAFYAVDYGAVMSFAQAARAAGTRQFIVVTAVGADPSSAVFYSRVKGEVERNLRAMGFDRLDIVQPGLLRGPRSEKRPVESLLKAIAPLTDLAMQGAWRRYRSVHANVVARSLLQACANTTSGVFIHQFEDIRRLAREFQSTQNG